MSFNASTSGSPASNCLSRPTEVRPSKTPLRRASSSTIRSDIEELDVVATCPGSPVDIRAQNDMFKIFCSHGATKQEKERAIDEFLALNSNSGAASKAPRPQTHLTTSHLPKLPALTPLHVTPTDDVSVSASVHLPPITIVAETSTTDLTATTTEDVVVSVLQQTLTRGSGRNEDVRVKLRKFGVPREAPQGQGQGKSYVGTLPPVSVHAATDCGQRTSRVVRRNGKWTVKSILRKLLVGSDSVAEAE